MLVEDNFLFGRFGGKDKGKDEGSDDILEHVKDLETGVVVEFSKMALILFVLSLIALNPFALTAFSVGSSCFGNKDTDQPELSTPPFSFSSSMVSSFNSSSSS